jgi:hypothetical protein
MQILSGVERPEIAGVVRDQNKIAFYRMIPDGPVLPACLSQVRDMMSLKTGLLGFAREFNR